MKAAAESGAHGTKSPLCWWACSEPAFRLRSSASLAKISAISSSSTNCSSLIRARAAVAMKVASGLRWAAATSYNSSFEAMPCVRKWRNHHPPGYIFRLY